MKRCYLLCLVVLLVAGCVTVPREPASPFQKVVEVNQPAEVLFARSLAWYANSFKSATAVIQHSSKETGTIIGKGQFPPGIPTNLNGFTNRTIAPVDFTITTEVKDGKARVTFSNLSITVHSGAMSSTDLVTQEFVDAISGYLSDLVNEYAVYINKKQEDW